MPWLKMRDLWTFRPAEVENKKFLFECKDAQSETGHSLLVHASATHSGIVNGNMKMYRPDRMQKGTATWLPPSSYAKPVLIMHDEEGEVVGRVRSADYVDLSWKWAKSYPKVKDTVFYNRDSRSKLTLFKSCDWIVDNLMPLEDFVGLGYIDLGFQITDTDAIRKVLNDEYLTVSTGSRTNSATCSICHTDWAHDDPCDHKLGKLYDKKRCYFITGDLKYDEVSFVNFPADKAALVNTKELKDALDKTFFLGLSTKQQDAMVEAGLKLTDALYMSDIVPVYEDAMIDFNDPKVRDQAIADLNAPEQLSRDRALAIRQSLDGWHPEADELKTTRRSIMAKVNTQISKKGWGIAPTENKEAAAEIETLLQEDKTKTPKGFFVCSACQSPADKCTCKDATCKGCGKSKTECTCKEKAKNSQNQDAKKCEKCGKVPCECKKDEKAKDAQSTDCPDGACENWDAVQLTDEEKEYFADADGLYEEMCVELDAAVKDGQLKDSIAKYAKLSSEARGKLGKGTFCGPNRSFPVPDCAHVTAARRLIGRAKVSQDTKSKILACVSRKSSSLGCGKDGACEIPATANADGQKPEIKIDDQLQKMFDASMALTDAEGKKAETSDEAQACLEHYDGLQKIYMGAAKDKGDLRWRMRHLHGAVGEHWGTLGNVDWAREYMAGHCKDSLIVSSKDLEDKENAINDLTVQKDTLVKQVEATNNKAATLLAETKKNLATTIVVFKALKGQDGFKDLNAELAQTKIAELAKRHITSLKDTVSDLLQDLQWAPPAAHQDAKTDESGVKVNDNAQVDESEAVNKDAATKAAQTEQDMASIRRKLSYMNAQQREIFLADLRFGRTAK
jgi:hypothetical protein